MYFCVLSSAPNRPFTFNENPFTAASPAFSHVKKCAVSDILRENKQITLTKQYSSLNFLNESVFINYFVNVPRRTLCALDLKEFYCTNLIYMDFNVYQ